MPNDKPLPKIGDVVGAEKLRKQLHISGINMMDDCGVRFEFRYIKGIRRPPSAFLITGTGTDKGIEADLNNKIQTSELLPEEDVANIAAEAVQKEADKEEIELQDVEERSKGVKVVVGESKDKAVRLVRAHHRHIAPEIKPSQVARRFSINMDKFLLSRSKEIRAQAGELFGNGNAYGAKILENQASKLYVASREGWDFAGEQDIVEKFDHAVQGGYAPISILNIRDSKTSSKFPSVDTADKSEQLTAYAVASHVLDGRLPDSVKLDYMIDLKRDTKTMTISSTRSMDDVGVFLNRFANAVYSIKSGIFVPTNPDNWRCSEKWCGYAKICPYFKKPKSVTVQQLITISGGSNEESNSKKDEA